jgi:glycosyltransferase involved in cell wall biosynthesis
MSIAPPYLILLKGGPTHDIDDHLTYHAQILSPEFEGEIWTFGENAINRTVGRFHINCVKVAGSGTSSIVKYLAAISRSVGERADVLRLRKVTFTTYEPFVQPFVAYWLARKLKGRLVIEFPGTYKDLDNLADIRQRWRRRLKYRRQQLLAQASVAITDAIRIHFPGQNEGFIHMPASKSISRYFDAIRLDRFQTGHTDPEKFILFVGYPFRRKGVDILLDAWRSIAPRHPAWRLVLIGYELDKSMSDVDLTSAQVEYIRPMSNAKLAPWVKRSSIVVVPSRSDTMPRILMEAAAAGKPRVASCVGGMPFMMTHGVDGLLVPPSDHAELGNALEKLILDQGLRERMGAAGLTAVKTQFSGERYCNDLLECVSRLHNLGKTDQPPENLVQRGSLA